MFKKQNITAKIIFHSILVMLLAGTSVGLLLHYQYDQSLLEKEYRGLRSEAQLNEASIQSRIRNLILDARFLSHSPPIEGIIQSERHQGIDPRDGSTTELWRKRLGIIFKEFLQEKSNYLEIRYVGYAEKGKEIVRVQRIGNQLVLASQEHLGNVGTSPFYRSAQRLGEGEISLSSISLLREEGRIVFPKAPVMQATIPVFDDQGAFFGVVTVQKSLKNLFNTIEYSLDDGINTFITNQRGDYIYHPNQEETFGFEFGPSYQLQRDIPALSSFFLSQEEKNEVSMSLEQRGHDTLLYFKKIHFDPSDPRRFLGIALTKEYKSPWKEILELNGYHVEIFALTFFLNIVLAALFARMLARPIVEITEAANRVAQGDYKVDIPSDHEDEIGVLACSFRKMIDQVEERNSALSSSKEEVERKSWLLEGHTELSVAVRGELELELLCQKVTSFYCNYLNCPIGLFYLINNHSKAYLVSSSGFMRRGRFQQTFSRGQGVVGQVLLEKKPIILRDIPEGYIDLRSGIQNTIPHSIIAFPVMKGEELLGIIELASHTSIEEAYVDFLSMTTGTVAIALESAFGYEKMQLQQRELQKYNEDLEERTKLLVRSQKDLQEQREQLQESNEMLAEKTDALNLQKEALEMKSAEAEENAKHLEIANKYKSEFLANMSHELRTPLNSMLILSKRFMENVDGNLTEEQTEEGHIIYDAGKSLLTIIEDILDLSKVEAGKLDFVFERVFTRKIVENMSRLFRHVAEEKGIDFHIVQEESVPTQMMTDTARLEQILRNLLSNAFKFTAQGSVTLKVHIPQVVPKAVEEKEGFEDCIAFSVIDTGIGVDKEKREAIFEAFQQADGSTSRKYGGTGLGLAISREFSERLGGIVRLEDPPEGHQGCCFTVYLPCKRDGVTPSIEKKTQKAERSSTPSSQTLKTEISTQAPQMESLDSSAPSLLIIEDDLYFSQSIKEAAFKHNIQCIDTENVVEGFDLACKEQPTVIFLDANLSGFDGYRLFEILKSHMSTRHIPVYFIEEQEENRHSFAYAKSARFLHRPLAEGELEKVFQEIQAWHQEEQKPPLIVLKGDSSEGEDLLPHVRFEGTQVELFSVKDADLSSLETIPWSCCVVDVRDASTWEFLKELQCMYPKRNEPLVLYAGEEFDSSQLDFLQRPYTLARTEGELLDYSSLALHVHQKNLSSEQKEQLDSVYSSDFLLNERKVLIVDDDMRNTFSLSKVLEKKGMNTLIAGNGVDALKALEQNPDVEIVLLDIMMPIMDGYETLEHIRAQEKYKDLPVITLTAKTMIEDRVKCIKAGANSYLMKPVDVESLIATMTLWLLENTLKRREGHGTS